MNAEGAYIFIGTAGIHGLSLIDDLTAEVIEQLKAEGFEPAVVVETYSNNFQAWLNFGRLAGFTNPKRERQLSSGM